MLNRISKMLVTGFVATGLCVGVVTGAASPAAAAKKVTTKAKKKPATTKKKLLSPAKPNTVSVPTAMVSKLSQAKTDALAAYNAFTQVYVAGYREPENAPSLYPPIMTGVGLTDKLREASFYSGRGAWVDAKWETFDLAIKGATETSVELTACIRVSGPTKLRSDGSIATFSGEIKPYISEKDYLFTKDKTSGFWKFAKDTHRELDEGVSSCADGR
jgi:hypothetical protein